MTMMQPVQKTILGTKITFYTSTPFTAADGTIVNPDKVIVAFSVDGATPVSFTYTEPTGDPTGTIIKNPDGAIGYYAATVDTTPYGAGIWAYSIIGKPTNYASDETKTAVRFDGTITVEAPAFTL